MTFVKSVEIGIIHDVRCSLLRLCPFHLETKHAKIIIIICDLTFPLSSCAHFSKANTSDYPQKPGSVLAGKRSRHSLDRISAHDQICELLTAISPKLKKKMNHGGFYLSEIFFFLLPLSPSKFVLSLSGIALNSCTPRHER